MDASRERRYPQLNPASPLREGGPSIIHTKMHAVISLHRNTFEWTAHSDAEAIVSIRRPMHREISYDGGFAVLGKRLLRASYIPMKEDLLLSRTEIA